MPRCIAVTVVLALVVAVLSGCQSAARPMSAADIQTHRDMSQEFLDRVHAEDWDGLTKMYTEDAVVMQPNQPALVGRAAIRDFWASMPPIKELRFVDDGIMGEGARYLVLEYVEGRTLAERLDRGSLPVDEAIELAVQIAAGVEAAHEAGVIHRDLKPGNIIITPEGKVKVLDFGLAKVAEDASSSRSFRTEVQEGVRALEAETVTSPVHGQHSPTMPGVILGTAAYMSPEQARGRSIDKRTDIWSFGVVL